MIRQNRIMLQVAGSDDLFWHDSALSRNRTKMFRDLGAVAPFEAVRGIEARIENLENRVRSGIPQIADPSRILAQSGSLGKLEPPSLPKDRPRVWCRLHLALQNGDLSVIWTHVSHLKRMTTEHITQALDQAVEVARSFAGC